MGYRFTLALVICTILSGCASDDHLEHTNELWRQGYGFNNPNYDRIKKGEKPLNLNGSVRD